MGQADVIFAFFNLGTGEVIILLLVILLLFGAKRLPELARGLGKGINEFKDAVNSGKEHIMDATDDIESGSINNSFLITIKVRIVSWDWVDKLSINDCSNSS